MNIQEYIDAIKQEAQQANESPIATTAAERLERFADTLKSFRAYLPADGTDEYAELDEHLEDLESRASDAAKICHGIALDIEEQDADERRYGSCEDQARADYRASVL